MNYRQSLVLSIAALAFAAPALSFAAQPASGEAATAITFNATASARSRVEVQQELQAARMNGAVSASQEGAFNFAPAGAGMAKTRDQVSSELSSSANGRGVSSAL